MFRLGRSNFASEEPHWQDQHGEGASRAVRKDKSQSWLKKESVCKNILIYYFSANKKIYLKEAKRK